MLLNKLTLINFKKYRRAELEFQKGFTGIIGGNGSGKSTLVEAIAWALYGNKASIIERDLRKNSNASESESVEVKLSVRIENQEYTISRAMKGKRLEPDASLSLDEKIAKGTQSVD